MLSTWDEIIDALGGTGAVADALAQSDSTVSGWRSRGIPSSHWAAVARLSTELGVGVNLEILADLAARKALPADTAEART